MGSQSCCVSLASIKIKHTCSFRLDTFLTKSYLNVIFVHIRHTHTYASISIISKPPTHPNPLNSGRLLVSVGGGTRQRDAGSESGEVQR